MDKRKGILNIGTSVASRVILLVVALYIRRLLIVYIGNEVNGLNSLYASIIGLLSVAELGVGSAIIFSMYKPIVEGDNSTVAALYILYRKLYRIIGIVILVAGLCVMPFLPKLIKNYDELTIDVYIPYLLTLLSVVISYAYSAKTSLIQAYKNTYITAAIATVCALIKSALQIAAIIIFKSYVAYVMCSIIETLCIWYLTSRTVTKYHPDIINLSPSETALSAEVKAEVSKSVRAMFMHKIGSVLVNAIDSMIISAFVGVMILGIYSNYIAIVVAMVSVVSLFFTPLTPVIGHLCATGEKEDVERYFYHFFSLNYILGIIFFLGFYAVIDNVIALMFGGNLLLPRAVTLVITMNQFISYLRYSQLLFRDATGTFYYDRWKPLFEGLSNLVLSILFVKIFPEGYEVAGVIAATILTNLLICDIIEPYVVYKYIFDKPAKKFYIKNYCCIAIFALLLPLTDRLMVKTGSNWSEFIINGFISVGISLVAIVLLGLVDRNFRNECIVLIRQVAEWIGKAFRKIRGGESHE